MMMMMGFGTRGRCKTKFRSCKGEVKKERRQAREKQGLKKKLGRRVTILFVTDLERLGNGVVCWWGDKEFGSLAD